jgi:hypothetical protein
MYPCPHCATDSFSFWQKQLLGPARSIECRNCKRRVSVPWARAMLAVSPIMILGSLGIAFSNSNPGGPLEMFLWGVFGAVVGGAIAAPLYHLYVPLVPRKH